MPLAIVVTKPVAAPIVATPAALLLHVPPAVASVSVVVLPRHNDKVPLIADTVLTVTTAVVIQPPPAPAAEVGVVKVITEVPADMPVTMPVLRPIVATPVALLVQVPAPKASVSVVVLPIHTLSVPDIAAGAGETVTVQVT